MALNFKFWGDKRLRPSEVDDNFRIISDEFDKVIRISDVTGTLKVGSTLRVKTLSPLVFEYVDLRRDIIQESVTINVDGQTTFSLVNSYDITQYEIFLFIDGVRFKDGFNIVSSNTLNWTNVNISLLTTNTMEIMAIPKSI